jgi:hypothetical protein
MRHNLSGRSRKSIMKLIVDAKTDKILGAHMLGEDAPEILQGIGVAVTAGATKATSTGPSASTRQRRRNSSPCGHRPGLWGRTYCLSSVFDNFAR